MEEMKQAALNPAGWVVRFVVAVCVAVAAFGTANAQCHYVPHVHVGAHAGMSMSRVSFYPKTKQMNLPGMQFGLSFRYAEERHVGLLAELNIEQRGWREDFEEANHQFEYWHRTTYVELPVMTHIFFGSRVVKGFFNLGPEIGYMIGDKVHANFDYENPVSVPGFPYEYRQLDQMKLKIKNRFDYGITAGAGVEFIIRKRHCIQLEGRYYYGLGNLFPSSKKDEFSASRGSSILVTLGYMFRLK
jgi:opacity protein-like surface antigen